MQFYLIIVNLLVLPWFVMSQIPIPYANQVDPPAVGVVSQQENPPSPMNNHLQPSNSNEQYLVGNLSESFTFQVAPLGVKISYLGLNGYSLYIMGVGFSNKSKFNYDEQTNRLTILSLDPTTVGSYSAVDVHWKTFTNVISAINISSFQIHNSHVSEDNSGSSLVSCSVSIIRSTFKLSQSDLTGTENLPRLDLFLPTRTSSSILPDKKIYNDTLNEQNFTRTITLQRPLTRADQNGTIQCQIESNNNIDVYLIKTVPIDVEYGPNLETGALPVVNLEGEVLKMIAMECQIEANPTPSYVWYEMLSNTTASQNVFGTTRIIQRIYQYPGQHAMQCQAQSRGKTVKQEFITSVVLQSNGMKTSSNIEQSREKSNKIPLIIGISIGCILFVLVIAIIIATIIFFKRRKMNTNDKHSIDNEKPLNEKQGKSRWGGLPIDYSKFNHESLKTDSSSTSHLVESAETPSNQPPPVPVRPSPMTSTHSSYRQAPSISLSYRQASALPGFRSPPIPSYSYDEDEVSTSINAMPLTINRIRTGSHKSLSESIQSLRSNQQPSISLPMKKRSNDLIKPEQKTSLEMKNDYQNLPMQLRINKTDNTSSEEEESEHHQQANQISALTSEYNQIGRQITPSQLTAIHHDELPPSYNQVANTSSPSHAYVYHEPTEV